MSALPAHRTIAAVVFDFGGVIRPGSPAGAGPESPYAALEGEFGLPDGFLWRAVYLENPAWLDLRVGQGTEADWLAATAEAIQPLIGVARAAALLDQLEEAQPREKRFRDRPVEFNPGMIELVESLRPRYRVSILSNAAPGLEAELAEHYRIAHLFHDIVNSATVGVAKPDLRIYRLAAQRLDVAIESCFFTDDLAHNIEAARAAGMVGHLFDGVAGLREALAAAGVKA